MEIEEAGSDSAGEVIGSASYAGRQAVLEADDSDSLGGSIANLRRPSFKGGEGSNLRRPSFKNGYSGMGISGLSSSGGGGTGASNPASIGESTRLSGLRLEKERRLRKMTVIRHAAQMSRTKVRAGKAPMRLDANEPVWLPRD